MIASKHLQKAKQLILKPENWGQKHFKVELFNEHKMTGYKFCATGALLEVDGGVENATKLETPAYQILGEVMQSSGAVCNFNDTHTHAEVLEKFDEAITLAISRKE